LLEDDFQRSSAQGPISAKRLIARIEALEHQRNIEKLRDQAEKVAAAMGRFVEAKQEERTLRRKSVAEAEMLDREMKEWEALRKKWEG